MDFVEPVNILIQTYYIFLISFNIGSRYSSEFASVNLNAILITSLTNKDLRDQILACFGAFIFTQAEHLFLNNMPRLCYILRSFYDSISLYFNFGKLNSFEFKIYPI